MKKYLSKTMILLLMLLVLLGALGCNGAVETDEVGYVIAVGVDKAEAEGQLKVSYQLALPTVLGGEGGSGGDKQTSKVITITGANLAECRNLLNSKMAVRPDLSHIKAIVIGMELARHGIGETFGPIMRFKEYRGTMFVMVAEGTAEDYLRNNKPLFEMTPAKYYELVMESSLESSYYIRSSLHQFYDRLKSKNGEAYAVLLGVNQNTTVHIKKADQLTPGQKSIPYKASELPVRGGNPVEHIGVAMFRGEKMVGQLDSLETRYFMMVLGKFRNSYLIIEDPLVAKYKVNLLIRPAKGPEIVASLAEGSPSVTVKVFLEGEITSISSGINYEEGQYTTLVENTVAAIVQQDIVKMLKHTQEVDSDVVGFGYYFRPLFATYPEYEKFAWNDRYNETEISVEVKMKIRRTGLMGKTFPVVPEH